MVASRNALSRGVRTVKHIDGQGFKDLLKMISFGAPFGKYFL
jgi:hypothetical protein